jgi:hypothetical protein
VRRTDKSEDGRWRIEEDRSSTGADEGDAEMAEEQGLQREAGKDEL